MYRVMIVDDEEPTHVAIRELVDWRSFGLHDPESAYNGQEGLKLLGSLNPDIVFIDMNMPLMNGIGFLEIAGKSHPDCRFVVISGYDSFQYARAAIRFGVVDYLLKPIERSELERVLRKVIEKLPDRQFQADKPSIGQIASAVKEYVDRHYRENIHVEEIAEKYFVSKEYLSRIFNSAYGCPVYEYLLRVRMHKGKELLSDPNLAIQRVAEMIGYNDANYFCKAFRRRYGCTPAEYRNSLK
ncbi:MAG: helix-turn-helix domain-containing protein [Clostridiales bacterium]|nr:helix-turn-helix domain-containing protein [Clostridiales bacterium]